MTNIAIDHRNSGFFHSKWWFSIVMLVYQRVSIWDLSKDGRWWAFNLNCWGLPKKQSLDPVSPSGTLQFPTLYQLIGRRFSLKPTHWLKKKEIFEICAAWHVPCETLWNYNSLHRGCVTPRFPPRHGGSKNITPKSMWSSSWTWMMILNMHY